MSETSPAQMPTVPQPRLKDTPIAVGSDSDSKTTTDTPFGVIISNDGVCAKESGAAVEEISSAVKRKFEQLQAPDAKKAKVEQLHTPDYDSETNAPRITRDEFMDDVMFRDREPDSDEEKENAQTLCNKFFKLRDVFDNRKFWLPGEFTPIHERYGSVGSHPDNHPEKWGVFDVEDFYTLLMETDILSCNDPRIILSIASWPHGGLVLRQFDFYHFEDYWDFDEINQIILTALRREIWDRANKSVMDCEMHDYIDDVMCPTMVRCLDNTDMDVVTALVSVPRFNPDAESDFPQAMTSPFENLPKYFRALPDIVLRAAQEHWDALSFAVDELKTEDFCRRCVEYHWQAIIHVPRDIQTEAFLMPLVQQSPHIYKHISPQLQNVRAIAFAAVSNDGLLLECLPYKLRMDYEINLAAVSNNGMAIMHISQSFRGQRFHTEQVTLTTLECTEYGVVDEALLIASVTQNPEALEYINDTVFHWFVGCKYKDRHISRHRERLKIWNSCRMRIVAAAANACRLKWGDDNLKSVFLRYLPRYELESDLFLSGLLHLCPFIDLAFEGRIDSEVAGLARLFRWGYALVDLDPKRWPTIETLVGISEEELKAMYEGHPLNHSLQGKIEQELEESPAKRQRMSPSE